MLVEQLKLSKSDLEQGKINSNLKDKAQLVFVFSSRELLAEQPCIAQIQHDFNNAQIVYCSTAGQIFDTTLNENEFIATIIYFEHTNVKGVSIGLKDDEDSSTAGARLATLLPQQELKHVLVISDGLSVNGTDLVKSMNATFSHQVVITGGLAGDGVNFQKTVTGLNDTPRDKQIIAIGLYGERLHVGFGSMGGWNAFGPEREVTKSENNVLYELDHQSALTLYKTYLGDHAGKLPSSGLLFPLSIRAKDDDNKHLVRTLLAIDEQTQSMTFAGDIPQGYIGRFMRCSNNDLVDGAEGAAQACLKQCNNVSPSLALMVSCVGRKLVMKQQTEDELESVKQILGKDTVLAGFYSYGEICPSLGSNESDLHNQTMTITTFYEK